MEEPSLRVVGGLLEELPGVEGNLLCRGGLAEGEEEELAVGGEGVEADWFGCRGWGEVPVHPALLAVGAVDARALWRGWIEEWWVMDGEVLAWVSWVERPRGAEAGGGGGVHGGGGSCCCSCGCGGCSGGGSCSGCGIGSGWCGGGGSGTGIAFALVAAFPSVHRIARGPVAAVGNFGDLDNHSPADLRKVIDELERQMAEQEATNAFLRELLTERWFASDGSPREEAGPLARL